MRPKLSTKYGDLYHDWQFCPLTDFVFFQEGPGLRKWQFTDSGMKVINIANILLDGTIDTSNSPRHIATEEYEQKYQHFAIEANDTVVSSSGWSYGKVGRIKAKNLPLMMNTSVIRFHPISEQTLDSSYLHKFLCSPFFSLQIEAYIIGSHQPNFGPSHVKRMKIVVPPLQTQRKIASILSAYEDLIENNTRRIAILEEMAQAIYREWFVNFRFPGHENVKLVDSPLGMIPEGWEWLQVSDVFETLGGGKPSKKVVEYWDGGDIAWFAPTDLTKSGNMYSASSGTRITEAGLQKSSAKMFPPYSVMLTSRATIGVLSINTVPACTNQGFITCVPNERVSALQIFFWLREQTEKILNVATGATFKEITKGNFRKFPFLLPTQELSEQFNNVVAPIGRNIELLIHKQDNLRTTRDLLLPKLISGQLDVEELDIDLGLTADELQETTA